jgi:hypothetical protein
MDGRILCSDHIVLALCLFLGILFMGWDMKIRKVILFRFRYDNDMVRYRYLGRRMFWSGATGGFCQLRSDHPSHAYKPERQLRKRWKSIGRAIMERSLHE